jgi:hypothetical protein
MTMPRRERQGVRPGMHHAGFLHYFVGYFRPPVLVK